MPSINYKNYHETLGEAIRDAAESLKNAAIDFNHEELHERFSVDGVKYGETKECHFELYSISGKPTKKFGNVSVYRMERGTYELTIYVL